MSELTGYLLINKPKDVTSFWAVNKIKRIIKTKTKIGHTGTLDPFATGLLIICISRIATRSIPTLLNLDKTYRVTAKLGEITDTLDLTGTIIDTCDGAPPEEATLSNIIENFGKTYVQTPPIYSALKHKGTPLYKLAREGKVTQEELDAIVEKKRRTVTIHSLTLDAYKPPYFSFTVQVSKGTYIRSLANDIAQKAGSCATTYELERTAIGSIGLDRATPLEKIETIDDVISNLLTKEQLL